MFFLFDAIIGFANNFSKFQTVIQVAAFMLWLASTSTLFLFLRRLQLKKKPKVLQKVKENLVSRSKLIDHRLFELQRRIASIDTVLERIGQEDTSQLQATRSKLLSAREIVAVQTSRYRLQEAGIVLVRLQNDLHPYLFGLDDLNEFQTEKGLVAVEQTKTKIERMTRDLGKNKTGEPLPLSSERQRFDEQLMQTIESCAKLREGLLGVHAVRAIADIHPGAENLPDRIDIESAHSVDTFNLQATITDFTESFEELEREYNRLKSEEDNGKLISQQEHYG